MWGAQGPTIIPQVYTHTCRIKPDLSPGSESRLMISRILKKGKSSIQFQAVNHLCAGLQGERLSLLGPHLLRKEDEGKSQAALGWEAEFSSRPQRRRRALLSSPCTDTQSQDSAKDHAALTQTHFIEIPKAICEHLLQLGSQKNRCSIQVSTWLLFSLCLLTQPDRSRHSESGPQARSEN